jgi:hypothetical protein
MNQTPTNELSPYRKKYPYINIRKGGFDESNPYK